MAEFTDRQAKAWTEAVAEAQKYVPSEIPLELHAWTVDWQEETRPGRGHAFDGVWTNGEHFVQIRMDVYGDPSVSVAELEWLHSSAYEDGCPCGHTEADRG